MPQLLKFPSSVQNAWFYYSVIAVIFFKCKDISYSLYTVDKAWWAGLLVFVFFLLALVFAILQYAQIIINIYRIITKKAPFNLKILFRVILLCIVQFGLEGVLQR